MIKHTIFAIGIGMLVFFLYLFQYTGAFKTVTVAIDQRPALEIIYKEHQGAYHKIVSTIEEVETFSKTKGFKCRLSFGEYFDNPDTVEEGRLRSRGGCVIDPLVPDELVLLKKIKGDMPKDFKLDTIPATRAVVALFSGAPGIGPLKVYPKAEEFIKENRLVKKNSVIEIYEVFDAKSMQTTYVWPVAN
ncbi:MAG: GyrI-like domain-containing protein [Bdellovibrio sp.]|nr:GyrI-like domain-containing protein [Bdellovibrio sp.]